MPTLLAHDRRTLMLLKVSTNVAVLYASRCRYASTSVGHCVAASPESLSGSEGALFGRLLLALHGEAKVSSFSGPKNPGQSCCYAAPRVQTPRPTPCANA
eukprot:s4644_g1.t1